MGQTGRLRYLQSQRVTSSSDPFRRNYDLQTPGRTRREHWLGCPAPFASWDHRTRAAKDRNRGCNRVAFLCRARQWRVAVARVEGVAVASPSQRCPSILSVLPDSVLSGGRDRLQRGFLLLGEQKIEYTPSARLPRPQGRRPQVADSHPRVRRSALPRSPLRSPSSLRRVSYGAAASGGAAESDRPRGG